MVDIQIDQAFLEWLKTDAGRLISFETNAKKKLQETFAAGYQAAAVAANASRALFDAIIAFANAEQIDGSALSEAEVKAYTAMIQAAMESEYWNESIAALNPALVSPSPKRYVATENDRDNANSI